MKRKSMLALLLAVSMTCSMTAATGTVAFASDDAATEEAADDTEAAADDADAAQASWPFYARYREVWKIRRLPFQAARKDIVGS